MSLIARATTPTKTGVTAAQVAKDVTTYGGVVVSVLSILANVPAFSHVFAAAGGLQAVIDAVVSVVTAIMSIKGQQTAAAAVKAAK